MNQPWPVGCPPVHHPCYHYLPRVLICLDRGTLWRNTCPIIYRPLLIYNYITDIKGKWLTVLGWWWYILVYVGSGIFSLVPTNNVIGQGLLMVWKILPKLQGLASCSHFNTIYLKNILISFKQWSRQTKTRQTILDATGIWNRISCLPGAHFTNYNIGLVIQSVIISLLQLWHDHHGKETYFTKGMCWFVTGCIEHLSVLCPFMLHTLLGYAYLSFGNMT